MTIWKSGLPKLRSYRTCHTLEGDGNGAPHRDSSVLRQEVSGKYMHRLMNGGIGHNLPEEAPQASAKAVIDVDRF
jgi:hypothetical protein